MCRYVDIIMMGSFTSHARVARPLLDETHGHTTADPSSKASLTPCRLSSSRAAYISIASRNPANSEGTGRDLTDGPAAVPERPAYLHDFQNRSPGCGGSSGQGLQAASRIHRREGGNLARPGGVAAPHPPLHRAGLWGSPLCRRPNRLFSGRYVRRRGWGARPGASAIHARRSGPSSTFAAQSQL